VAPSILNANQGQNEMIGHAALSTSRRFVRMWPRVSSSRSLIAVAVSILSSTAALSGFDEGEASYWAGDYKAAFKEWSDAAQHGDVDAQYNLGCLYVRGEGVPKNRAWAVDWFRRAADQNDIDAATWLLFSDGPPTDEDRKKYFSMKGRPIEKFHITFVAQLGDGKTHRRPCTTDEKDGAEIEFSLGLMYEMGNMGLPQDDKKAAEWYRRASERGQPDAQTKLAYLYAAGRGVERNEAEAFRLFRDAAAHGNATAQANLGDVYAGGNYGQAQDLALAYVLLSHAADAGNKIALDDLPRVKPFLSPKQLREGEALAEKWKGGDPWPQEVAERVGLQR
jgi:uncharacterized protein